MENTYVFQYPLKKRYHGLYNEIFKMLGFYFAHIQDMRLENENLEIKYQSEQTNQADIENRISQTIQQFVNGYHNFDEVIISESKCKKEKCKKVDEKDYIEIAEGIRCQIGDRALLEDSLSNFILRIYDKLTSSIRVNAPSMISYHNLVESGYFTKFPNLVNFIKNFNIDPELIRNVSSGKIDLYQAETMEEHTFFSKKVLNPVTCYQVYPMAKRLMKQTKKKNFTVTGKVFRFESYNMNETRLNEFKIIEQVHFGTKDKLFELRQKEMTKFEEIFNDWELDFTIKAASDMFYGDEAALLISSQNYEKGKYELKMKCDQGELSVGSFNFHNQYFTDRFQIQDESKAMASGCSGVGVERLTHCILSQHGSDRSLWPKKLQRDLNVGENSYE